ncbi:MAG: polysaccharide biosynthesis tyrosine autokinase [Candidatus Tectomicrobia bacterium]|nr:polysaccharide biosynthesis tyrosine autokinase [Candidatus Tectomicrobia bacterium]
MDRLPEHLADLQETEEAPSLRDYLKILRSHTRLIIACLLAAILIAAFMNFNTDLVYQASTTLIVEKRESGLQIFEGLDLAPQSSAYEAEREIIKSRGLAMQVIDQLKLNYRLEWSTTFDQLRVGLKTFLDRLPGISTEPPQLPSIVLLKAEPPWHGRRLLLEPLPPSLRGAYAVRDEAGQRLAIGRPGIEVSLPGLSFALKEGLSAEAYPVALSFLDPTDAAEDLRERIIVDQVGRSTNVLHLRAQSNQPRIARDIVNELARSYHLQNIQYRSQEAAQTEKFLDEQLLSLRAKLEEAENKLIAYKRSEHAAMLSSEADALVTQVANFELEKSKLELQEAQIEGLLASLAEGKDPSFVLSGGILTDPVIASLVGTLAQLEIEKRALLERFRENSLEVRQVDIRIEAAKERIRTSVRKSLDNLRNHKQALGVVLRRYQEDLQNLPAKEQQLVALTRTAKVNENLYTLLLNKYEEARIVKASTVGNVRILNPARTPRMPIEPRAPRSLLLGAVLGLMAGIGLSFLLEWIDQTIHSPMELEQVTRLPLYGVILDFTKPRFSLNGKSPAAQQSDKLALVKHPKSHISEAYRSLRTNIRFTGLNRPLKTLLVTSSLPGEGKTTTVANLGVAMANLGLKTLLLDLDLRRPALHTLFGMERQPGFTDAFGDRQRTAAQARPTSIENLSLLPAGFIPPNPSELLSQQSCGGILRELADAYDLVLIDSPPLLPVSDVAVLAPKVDGILLISRHGIATPESVRHSIAQLRSVNAPILGCVFNAMRLGHHTYDYYYRYYRSYYTDSGGPNGAAI